MSPAPADGSGRSCWPGWERTYDLSALNRSHVAGVPCTQADIADLDGIVPAFEGVDAVLHLAASTMAGDWESLLATNIVGVRNVYEAARIQGVKRVVNISSGATILGYGLESPYKDLLAGEYEKLPEQWPLVNERWPIRPDSVYGASKAWGEALGRYYSDYHGLSVICVRLGAFLADDTPDNPRSVAGYTSWEDAMRMFSLCIDAPDERPIRPVRAGFGQPLPLAGQRPRQRGPGLQIHPQLRPVHTAVRRGRPIVAQMTNVYRGFTQPSRRTTAMGAGKGKMGWCIVAVIRGTSAGL